MKLEHCTELSSSIGNVSEACGLLMLLTKYYLHPVVYVGYREK